MFNTCILIDTRLRHSVVIDKIIVSILWKTLCEKFPSLTELNVDFEKSKIVSNIQRGDNVSIQYVLQKLPSNTFLITEMVSVIENYFLSNNLSDALPISIRAMSKIGSRIKIDTLI